MDQHGIAGGVPDENAVATVIPDLQKTFRFITGDGSL